MFCFLIIKTGHSGTLSHLKRLIFDQLVLQTSLYLLSHTCSYHITFAAVAMCECSLNRLTYFGW